MSLIGVLLLTCLVFAADGEHTSGVRIRVSGNETLKDTARYVPPDRGGNYGDLIYRTRENGDGLLLRELVVLGELSAYELEVQWYARVDAHRVSSVRVLNLGRERAFCERVDVLGAEVQTWLRVAPRYDPRVLIEIYGF
ncbi:hypothetical protein TcasGA2_TC014619 [Tribolium castaneum]|uniref:Uncharacterized protein n=1 Tax=Tribolium castaneum TaxID=7070 RepID=D6WMZ2_TRICA|nr:hypothetical protein TcasGA2_TC014619 [Tribolium castaneum]